jgi:deoxycytidylate deaminase
MKPIKDWTDLDFMRQAYANADDMGDGLVVAGAVLAPAKYPEHHLVYGANSLPRGVLAGPHRNDVLLEAKCLPEITPAVCSVIYLAAFRGTPTQGATLYYTSKLKASTVLAIINSGITRVVGVSDDQVSSTLFLEIHELFRNVGVEYEFLYKSDIFPKEQS